MRLSVVLSLPPLPVVLAFNTQIMDNGLGIITHSKMTISIMTLTIMTLSIMTL
jgi:hypothetical protein